MISQEKKVQRGVGAVAALAGLAVIVGWFTGSDGLIRLFPGFVSMKPLTAICFVALGVQVVSMTINTTRNRELHAAVIGSGTTFLMFVLMGVLLVDAHLSSVDFGFERLIVAESEESAVRSVSPGQPSVGTMLAFLLCGSAGMSFTFKSAKWQRFCFQYAGVIGAGALIGYIVGIPALYFDWPDRSTAMALHTAGLFAVVGFACALTAPRKRRTTQ